MPLDANAPKETQDAAEHSVETAHTGEQLSVKGIHAMQGKAAKDETHPARDTLKGSNFENWAKQEVFQGRGRRLNVLREYNEHLIDVDDEQMGLKKTRRYSDAYLDGDGYIQELKAGYEKGGVDPDQAKDYSLMQDAGYIYEKTSDGEIKRTEIKGGNYIFDGKTGAEANRCELEQYGFGIFTWTRKVAYNN